MKTHKFLIVGRQGSGVLQVIHELENLGVSVGHIFRSLKDLKPESYTLSQKTYPYEDIEKMEITHAYIFLQERFQREKFIEGLSFWDYDSNDVIYMGVDQLAQIPEKVWSDLNVIIVWLDDNTDNRMSRLSSCNHDVMLQENNEKPYIQGFVDRVYDKPYLYFFNETPERTATIIWSLAKYPDLTDIYIKNFN